MPIRVLRASSYSGINGHSFLTQTLNSLILFPSRHPSLLSRFFLKNYPDGLLPRATSFNATSPCHVIACSSSFRVRNRVIYVLGGLVGEYLYHSRYYYAFLFSSTSHSHSTLHSDAKLCPEAMADSACAGDGHVEGLGHLSTASVAAVASPYYVFAHVPVCSLVGGGVS
jgi:hypothetical protein